MKSVLVVISLVFAIHVMAEKRPNIIVFLTDDQTQDAVGYAGKLPIKTPNIDQLAQDGVWFQKSYSNTSICMAARAIIMTGMHEYKTGCNFMHGALRREKFEQSYPMILKREGYYVGFAGKFGYAVTDDENAGSQYHDYDVMPVADFDWWAGGPGQTSYKTAENKYLKQYADDYPHASTAYGAAVGDFLVEAQATGKPFCLSMSFKAPHGPYSPDPQFDHLYEKGQVFEKPVNYGKANAKHLPKQSKLGRQYGSTSGKWDADSYDSMSRKYYQLIYGPDYAIGMIREKLEELGMAENTIIIFTSDNGFSYGNHGMGDKVLPYEEASKVPMIVFDPRSKNSYQSLKSNGVVGSIDVAPTVLDAAGLAVPKNMDGLSMLSMVDTPQKHTRDVMPLIQTWGNAPTQALAIVSSDWKYIYWPYADGMGAATELYQTTTDGLDMNNCIGQEKYKSVQMHMEQAHDEAMKKWAKEAVDFNDYKCFATIFDRHKSWEEKEQVMPKQFMKSLNKDLDKTGASEGENAYDALIKQVEEKYAY